MPKINFKGSGPEDDIHPPLTFVQAALPNAS